MSKHNIFELALTSNDEDSRILGGFKLQYNTALPAAVALPLALKLLLCCPGIVLVTGPSECRVTINFELNWIYFILFAMAPYGVVSQLLALVQ